MSEDARHRVWSGSEWLELAVATMHGEALSVPIVNALLYRDPGRDHVLLQRRDKPAEVTRGKWELPGGRLRAGEAPTAALAREVLEETGIRVTAIEAAGEMKSFEPHVSFEIVRPLAVIAGIEGSFPSVHILLSCLGNGEPRPQPGESAEPTWWPLDDVLEALRDRSDDFVWHSRAMHEAALLG